jgi:hypothetical protein
MKCELCDGTGWVCENHPHTPWAGEQACGCGGAGAPCPTCNVADAADPPRLLGGFKAEVDKDGWRN